MRLTNKEKILAEKLSKAFGELSNGDISGSRQQVGFVKRDLHFDSEQMKRLFRRIGLD